VPQPVLVRCVLDHHTGPEPRLYFAAQHGTIAGSLAGTPSDGPIGSGPWNGSASGILNLAASPTLTISKSGGAVSGGSATIQGTVNTASTGPVISNSGFFDQTLKKSYDPNSRYTLTAYVSSNSFANSDLLASDGVGIALSNGANILASSTTADPSLVSLSLFSGNTYKLALIYITASNAPAGNINIELFDDPNGLGRAHVFSSVSFSNVDLTEANASATPEPATFALAGMVLLGLGAIKRSRKIVSAAS
jgi:PEP-CTERM motif